MTTLSIQQNPDFILHVSITPTHSPPNSVVLKVESQWLGAKDPFGRQVRYQVILSAEDAKRVAAELENQANSVDTASTI